VTALAAWLERHRRSVAFVFVALVVAGAASATRLPVALFPRVDFPRIVVSVDAGDRPADRMAIEVTRPVEEALRGVPGVRRVRSSTSRGSADVSVSFDWGDDMGAALLMADSVLNGLVPSLPSGTAFSARRMDPTVFPVLAYSLTSPTLSLVELRNIADQDLRPLIATVEGVGSATVQGGRQEELRVTVDPGLLLAYGLQIDDVVTALGASNTVAAVGRLEDLHVLYLVVSQSTAADIASLGEVVVRTDGEGVVQVEDVATISDEVAPEWTRVSANGRDAVLLNVYQQPSGNTVEVAAAVRALIAERQQSLPPDAHIEAWYDQSELIEASAGSVRDAVLIGVALACLVLLAFLRSIRVTIIAAIAVPGVLAGASLLLGVLGMSFNIMTLGGMAAAVGLVIDDAIVMIEHIEARRSHGESNVLAAAADLTRPLIVSSSVTVVVFAPLAFLSGVTGAFFRALSLTMASSLVISFFVAWLVVPILAERFLPATTATHAPGAIETRVLAAYRWLAERAVGRPLRALLFLIPLVALGAIAEQRLGSGFMPSMDEGGFIIDYRARPGAALAETDALCRQVEAILAATPEVESYSRRTGLQLGGGITEANEGDYFVRLRSARTRGVEDVMDDVRTQVAEHVPGLDTEMAQLMEDLIGDLTAVPQPIEIEVFSDDPEVLSATADHVVAAISAIPGVVDVQPGVVLAGDALHVEVDGARAALEGLDANTISTALTTLLDGNVATEIQRDPRMIGVRVWTPRHLRASEHDVERLTIEAPSGHLVPIHRVASITRVSGEPQITRDDLRRMVAVTGRITGRDMGSVMRDVQAALAHDGVIPTGVTHRLGGLYAEQQAAFGGLVAVFGAAVALVFMLLLYVYESFRVATSMMITTLLAICAVMIGLWVTGTPLNISSMMGMTMVVGIVTEVAVFYVSELTNAHADSAANDRFVKAGVDRFRPIAMTTLAAILALLPLALAIGEGSSMEQPLAIAIIAGLVAQLPLVLVVLPALLRALRWTPTPTTRPIDASDASKGD
jgi:multidrug efflux pump subunit AcrB